MRHIFNQIAEDVYDMGRERRTCSENVAAPVGRVVSRTDVSSRRSEWNWEPPEVLPPVPHRQRMQKLNFGEGGAVLDPQSDNYQ